MGTPVAQLSRTGSSLADCVWTTPWQFMHVCVDGTFACGLCSTWLWQYRQSIPSCPAWSAWLYGTGCSGWYPTS